MNSWPLKANTAALTSCPTDGGGFWQAGLSLTRVGWYVRGSTGGNANHQIQRNREENDVPLALEECSRLLRAMPIASPGPPSSSEGGLAGALLTGSCTERGGNSDHRTAPRTMVRGGRFHWGRRGGALVACGASGIVGPKEDARASTWRLGLSASLARNSFPSPAQTHSPETLFHIRALLWAFPTKWLCSWTPS